MKDWLLALITAASSVALSYIITQICINIHKRGAKYKESVRREEDERMAKVINSQLDPKFENIDKKFDRLDKRIDKMEEDLEKVKAGDQASLRNDLYQLYNDCSKKGFATLDERENFINLYDKYHVLGANGVMDDLKVKFLDLPTEKIEKKKTRLAE